MSKQETKKQNDTPRAPKDEMDPHTEPVAGAETPAEEKFYGTSDGNCPVCAEHGEKHQMRVDLKDWTCPRCSYREPVR